MADELRECEAHGTPTRLRCAEPECGRPICPRCLVKTAVGLKCEEHAAAIAPRFDRRVAPFALAALVMVAAAVGLLALAVVDRDRAGDRRVDTVAEPAVGGGAPGGTRIVPAQVHVVGVDGAAPRTLTNRPLAFDANPAWSPDGGRIAFESTLDGKRAIWVMQSDGLGLRRLTDGPGAEPPRRGRPTAAASPSPATATATRRSTSSASTARGCAGSPPIPRPTGSRPGRPTAPGWPS